jgi:two-component system, chemotaxis family, chemotaxis protein CheY
MALKIIVVDDAPFIREIVKQILSDQSGYKVIGEAEDGLKAVELAQELKPDIIFMDIVMPEMSGIKATEEILKFDASVKIIAFTTMDESSIQKKAMKAGCRGLLKKPFTKVEFLNYLKKVEYL